AARAQEKIGEIETLWGRLKTSPAWTDDVEADLAGLITIIHKLTGLSASFGLGRVAETAAPLEVLLRGLEADRSLANADRMEHAAFMITALLKATEETVFTPQPDQAVVEELSQRVVLVGPDRVENCSIALKLEHYGYETTTAEESKYAFAAIVDQTPALVILIDAEGGFGEAFLASFADGQGMPPLLVISEVDSFESRLAAARAGCVTYLVRPGELSDLVDWVERITGAVPEDPYRVLIVDDDPYLTEAYALILEAAGMLPSVLSDPRKIFERIEDETPDVILVDLYMPDVSGFDLAKVVRQTKRYLGIPIIFLSTQDELSRRRHALIFGGDDFLAKPISGDELILAVKVRAARARSLRTLMDRDSLTGLLNHGRICDDLAQEVARAERAGHPLTLAILDLDHFKRVNDSYGHQAGDTILWSLGKLLSKRLRKSDIVGRYGGEEFAVILTDTDTNTAFYVIDEIRRIFEAVPREADGEAYRLTLSAGLSGWERGMSAEDLIELADSYLYKAKAQGRNRVVTGEGFDEES
ncbi:MAG: diguanylate cyclase, partial [Sphingomonadales bacterium]